MILGFGMDVEGMVGVGGVSRMDRLHDKVALPLLDRRPVVGRCTSERRVGLRRPGVAAVCGRCGVTPKGRGAVSGLCVRVRIYGGVRQRGSVAVVAAAAAAAAAATIRRDVG